MLKCHKCHTKFDNDKTSAVAFKKGEKIYIKDLVSNNYTMYKTQVLGDSFKAVQVSYPTEIVNKIPAYNFKVWIPKSLIEIDKTVDNIYYIDLPEWFIKRTFIKDMQETSQIPAQEIKKQPIYMGPKPPEQEGRIRI